MKLGAFFLLVATTTAFPSLSSIQIWLANLQQPLKNFIDNPHRRSTIPQFILDTEHPWVLTNQRKLENLPDAASFLCSLQNNATKVTGIDIRNLGGDLDIPAGLFKYLRIDNNSYGMIWRPGWPNALARLEEMKRCERALQEAELVAINVLVYDGNTSNLLLRILEPSHPPEQLLVLFGDVLELMVSLERLLWDIPKEYTHFFEKAFISRNLTLLSVKTLKPSSSNHYLVGMCPNLEALENGGNYEWYQRCIPDDRDWELMFIQSAVSTPKVKRLNMERRCRGWTPSLVSEIVRSMPQLEGLKLWGPWDTPYCNLSMDNSAKLKGVVDILTGLENLTDLALPQSLGLDISGPWCKSVIDWEHEQQSLQFWEDHWEATEKAGQIVVTYLPHLTRLSIGGLRATITKSDDGVVNVTWPWA